MSKEHQYCLITLFFISDVHRTRDVIVDTVGENMDAMNVKMIVWNRRNCTTTNHIHVLCIYYP